jgi:hypothetical protein
MKYIKGIWQSILSIMESMGRAKAAAHLTRMGLHKEARAIMLE